MKQGKPNPQQRSAVVHRDKQRVAWDLRGYLKGHGLSVEHVARKIGVPAPTMYPWFHKGEVPFSAYRAVLALNNFKQVEAIEPTLVISVPFHSAGTKVPPQMDALVAKYDTVRANTVFQLKGGGKLTLLGSAKAAPPEPAPPPPPPLATVVGHIGEAPPPPPQDFGSIDATATEELLLGLLTKIRDERNRYAVEAKGLESELATARSAVASLTQQVAAAQREAAEWKQLADAATVSVPVPGLPGIPAAVASRAAQRVEGLIAKGHPSLTQEIAAMGKFQGHPC